MQTLIILLGFFSFYCYADESLGGWSLSTDEELKAKWLKAGLNHIRTGEGGDDVQSSVSDLVCHTQIVDGMNIKCKFTVQNQKWQCSFYQAFIEDSALEIDDCLEVDNTPTSKDNDDNEKDAEEPAAQQKQVLNEEQGGGGEEDDELKVDELNQQQLANQNENNQEKDDEEQIK